MKNMRILNSCISYKYLKGQNKHVFYIGFCKRLLFMDSFLQKVQFKNVDIHLHLGATVLQKKVGQSIIMFRWRYLTNLLPV